MRVLGYCSIEGAFRAPPRARRGIEGRPRNFVCVLCRRHWRTCRPPALGRLPPDAGAARPRPFIGFYALRQSRSKPSGGTWTPKELDQVYWVEAAWWRCLRFFAETESEILLVRRTRGAVCSVVAPRGQKTRAREMTQRHRRDEEKTHRGAYELTTGFGRRRRSTCRTADVGFCPTPTHGARGRRRRPGPGPALAGRGVGLVSTTACPRTRARSFGRGGRRGPRRPLFCTIWSSPLFLCLFLNC